jgi:hypothetical protein
MDKTAAAFFVCATIIFTCLIVSITFYNHNLSEKNSPILACIKEHGNWSNFQAQCTFPNTVHEK